MKNRRLEDWIIILAALIAGIGIVSKGAGLNTPVIYLSGLGVSIINAIALYSALSVRRILGVRLYRHQALGVGLIVIAMWLSLLFFSASGIFANNLYLSNGLMYVGGGFIFMTLLATFYWIDSSVRSAMLSDPMVRDPLRWRQVRLILWPTILTSVALIVLLLTFFPNSFQNASFGLLYPIAIFGVFLSGAIFVPVYARKSGDRTLRIHLQWFGLFLVSVLGSVVLSGLSAAFTAAGFAAASFCLYRSARTLVPIFHFSDETN